MKPYNEECGSLSNKIGTKLTLADAEQQRRWLALQCVLHSRLRQRSWEFGGMEGANTGLGRCSLPRLLGASPSEQAGATSLASLTNFLVLSSGLFASLPLAALAWLPELLRRGGNRSPPVPAQELGS